MNIEEIASIINDIKSKYEVEVIKDYHIRPLVNTKTGKDTGFAATLQLNTRFDFDNDTIHEWKERLMADCWYVNVKRNQLRITFNIHFL